jgi:esterase/lipase superfamily enzyme
MIDVYFATNRDPVADKDGYFGERFHSDGPMFYRVGMAQLEKISDDADDCYEVKKVRVFTEKADKHEEKVIGSTKVFTELREQMRKDKRDVVVLIHGFANTFVNSLQRAAQIKQAYLIDPRGPNGLPAPDGKPYEPYVIVFSWPSNGRVQPPWEYHDDRQDAAASGVAMARFMRRLVDFMSDTEGKCEQRIHLVAHSMGNWALRNAVQQMIALVDHAKFPTLFTNAILIGADDDDDTFENEQKMARLPELARSIHVYHSRNDRALFISDTTKFNPDRLGSGGPKSFSGLSNRIVAIDCSGCDSTEFSHGNHQYYRIRTEVIGDIRAVLSGRFLPDQIPNRSVVESGRRYRIGK